MDSLEDGLSDLGLPKEVLRSYADRGISSLFPWQEECLRLPGVLDGGRNLVYSAPTSAGKTLVAELVLLKRVLESKGRGLFILPFISVAREKMLYLHALFRNAGVQVQGYMGTLSPPGDYLSWDVAVCTIEKANGLVNRLIEEDNLSNLTAIVVDEIHLVRDVQRGQVLELLLTKIMHYNKQKHSSMSTACGSCVQIIGMSATLPKIEAYGKWLDAHVYRTDYRPIPLTEHLFVGGNYFNKKFEKIRSLDNEFVLQDDPDNVTGVCLETVTIGCGVLIFCATKAWCERLASLIAENIKRLLHHGSLSAKLQNVINEERQEQFIEGFATISGLVDPVLKSTLPYAVGFHHAGLTMEERERLENGFRAGTVRVLVATSTLSSGVNLPAKRVIIRSPWGNPRRPGPCLYANAYKQMIGRAGRKGLDSTGESVLICKESELQRGRCLLQQADQLENCEEEDPPKATVGLLRILLEAVVNGMVRSQEELTLFLSSTLSYATWAQDGVKEVIQYLVSNDFIRAQGDSLTPTQLGCATVSSAMSPAEALTVFSDLQKAKRGMILENDLHLVYLVTPLYLVENMTYCVSWLCYLERWQSLDTDCKRVGQMVGIEDGFLVGKVRSSDGSYARGRDARRTEVHLRFYVALALFELIQEVPIAHVSARYGCNRGSLQALQQQASTYAAMVITFVDRLGWYLLKSLLCGFAERLAFGVKRDLTELVRVDGLDGLRARRFHEAGITTVANLAQTSLKAITVVLGKAVPFRSSSDDQQQQQHRNTWLAGHGELSINDAAEYIRNQARRLLRDQLRQFGAVVSLEEAEGKEDEGSSDEPLLNSDQQAAPNAAESFRDEFPSVQVLMSESWFEPATDGGKNSTPLAECNHLEAEMSRVSLSPKGRALNPIALSMDESELLRVLDGTFSESTDSSLFDPGWNTNQLQQNSSSDFDIANDPPQADVAFVDIGNGERAAKKFLKSLLKQPEYFVSIVCDEGALMRANGCGHCHKSIDNGNGQIGPSLSIAVCWNRFQCFYLTSDIRNDEKMTIVERVFRESFGNDAKRTVTFSNLRHAFRVAVCLFGEDFMAAENCRCLSTAAWMLNPDGVNIQAKELMAIYSPENLSLFDVRPGLTEAEISVCTAVLTTCVLSPILYKAVNEKGMWRAYSTIEIPAQWVVAKMELNGVKFDRSTCDTFCETLKKVLMQLESQATKMVGRNFSLSSPSEVSRILFHEFKLPAEASHLLQRHAPGRAKAYSTSKIVLEKLFNLHPLPALLFQWRQMSFALNHFVYPLRRAAMYGCQFCSEYARLHGRYDWFTATGRLVMHSPNLQNIPKGIDVPVCSQSVPLRNVIIAKKGCLLLSADFSQLELRILAHLANDQCLLKLLNDGFDVFRVIASEFLRIPAYEVSSDQRDHAKLICYGIIYGMGSAALAQEMNVTEDEAMQFYSSFKNRFTGIIQWMQTTIEQCRRKGFVMTISNRIRHLPEIKSSNMTDRLQAERRAVNTSVQGSAADIFKLVINAVDRRIAAHPSVAKKVKLVMQLHDEIIFEVENEALREVSELVKEAMENATSLRTRLVVNLKAGPSWGHMIAV